MGVAYGFYFVCALSGLIVGMVTALSIKAKKH